MAPSVGLMGVDSATAHGSRRAREADPSSLGLCGGGAQGVVAARGRVMGSSGPAPADAEGDRGEALCP